MKKLRVLVIADEKDSKILDTKTQSEHWDIFWEIINYNELYRKVGKIQELIKKSDIDFVLYSRNDQVANRISIGLVTKKLRTGYSSFSGIDEKYLLEQTKVCFDDFIECNKTLNFSIRRSAQEDMLKSNYVGEFSLIFDTEQIGGVKYGLPRILGLLKRYNVRATFFVTNLMKKVYPNVLEVIREQGHEIGIHGLYHEYLLDFEIEKQAEYIQTMKRDFGEKVIGANFIGRMNVDTLEALVENGIKYFAYPIINYYRFISYPKLFAMPSLVNLSNSSIWMFPVSVETYDRPWFSIKNIIDSALLNQSKSDFFHISILCHPFRDGNLAHIETTEKLLNYLLNEKRLRPTTLRELIDKLLETGRDFPEVSKEHLFRFSRRFCLPQTKQDFLNMIPENLMALWRIVRKGRTLW